MAAGDRVDRATWRRRSLKLSVDVSFLGCQQPLELDTTGRHVDVPYSRVDR